MASGSREAPLEVLDTPIGGNASLTGTGAAASSSVSSRSRREASARRARHADYGQCWGEGAARCFSIEGDFLDEDQGVRLMPVPESFICPISLSIMVDPVTAVDGTIYERDYIERWIRQQRQDRKPITSPVTGLELHSTVLMPLAALQRAIETYMACRPELRQVPTEGRSFEEAAQALQSDLIEKQSKHDNAQEVLTAMLDKRDEEMKSMEEKHSALMKELDRTRVQLQQALARLRYYEGESEEPALLEDSCCSAIDSVLDGSRSSASSSSSAHWGHRGSVESRRLPGDTASAVSAALAASQPPNRDAVRAARERGGRVGSGGRPEASASKRRKGDARCTEQPALIVSASKAKAFIFKMANHRWTLPSVLLVVAFASYVALQSDLHSDKVSTFEPLKEPLATNLGVCLSCSQLSPLGNSSGSKMDKKATKQKARNAANLGDLAGWQDEQDRSRGGTAANLVDVSIARQVELLQHGAPDEKRNVAFSLWNVAVGNSQAQVAIAQAGAIVPLVGLLHGAESDVKEAAAAVLGSLAEHSQYRAAIAKAGAIKPLIAILEDKRAGTRVVAARALWGLTTGNTVNQASIARAGAIPLLVRLLSDSVSRVRVAAGAALCGLAIDHTSNQVAIAKAGGIEPLVGMLREEDAGARVTAAAALRNLAIANIDNQAAVVKAGAIKPLVDLLWDDKAAAQEDAAYMLANLAANNANHRTWIGRAGAIAPLIQLLESRASDLQEAASMVLRNLAGDNLDNAEQIVQAGAISSLVKVVTAGMPRVRKQAAWALWNLATASSDNLAAVVRARAVAPIVKELGDTPAAREEIHATLLRLAADYWEPEGS